MSLSKPHIIKTFAKLKLRYLLALTLISAVTCVVGLRANNEHMIRLRSDVFKADQSGTNVDQALQALQAYVTTHMNTSLTAGNGSIYPPIQLKYTYQRLLANESAQAAQANSGLYTAAQTYCQALVPTGFSGRYRVPCIEQYVEAHDTALPVIPDGLYKFNFVSPAWSPDLAGWSIVSVIVLAILSLLRLALKLFKRD